MDAYLQETPGLCQPGVPVSLCNPIWLQVLFGVHLAKSQYLPLLQVPSTNIFSIPLTWNKEWLLPLHNVVLIPGVEQSIPTVCSRKRRAAGLFWEWRGHLARGKWKIMVCSASTMQTESRCIWEVFNALMGSVGSA